MNTFSFPYNAIRCIKQNFFKPKPRGKNKQLVHREFNIPLHPHNQALQIWFELGFIGACIVSLFGGLVIWRISTQEYGSHLPPVMYAFIVSILIFDLLIETFRAKCVGRLSTTSIIEG